MTNIIMDCDGVMLDWVAGFKKYLIEEVPDIQFTSELPGDYILSIWTGMDRETVREHMLRFNEEREAFATLPAFEGAKEVLEELYNRGARFHVVSACSANPTTREMRMQNLHDAFGEIFASVELVSMDTPKSEVLQKFEPSIWIEDHVGNARMGMQLGHHSILKEGSNNVLKKDACIEEGIKWTTNWAEIREAIIDHHPELRAQLAMAS